MRLEFTTLSACFYFEMSPVTKHGISESFYCDKLAILISPKDGNLTSFGYMFEFLDINIIATNTPRAKDKVEKLDNTIQN